MTTPAVPIRRIALAGSSRHGLGRSRTTSLLCALALRGAAGPPADREPVAR